MNYNPTLIGPPGSLGLQPQSRRDGRRGSQCSSFSDDEGPHSMICTYEGALDEESCPEYAKGRYYPIRPTETYGYHYEVIAKLGFGSRSTVWLARDKRKTAAGSGKCYVVLKMLISDVHRRSEVPLELEMSNVMKEKKPGSAGLGCLLTAVDSFRLEGSSGPHTGLVFETMREDLGTTVKRWPGQRLSVQFLKPITQNILTALDYMHSVCRIIHTDIQHGNILLGLESLGPVDSLVEDNTSQPNARRDGKRVYVSVTFDKPMEPLKPESAKLADFSHACYAYSEETKKIKKLMQFMKFQEPKKPNNRRIQPSLYRAPEVILRAKWSYAADIWNLGCLLWHLYEGRSLFHANKSTTGYSRTRHLEEMIAHLGPMPEELLRKGDETRTYFDSAGNLINASGDFHNVRTLDSRLAEKPDGQDKSFQMLIRSMLQLNPAARPSAKDLLDHPSLTN